MATLLSPLFPGGGFGLKSPDRRNRPILDYNGDVFYLDTPEMIDWWCDYMRYWQVKTVGFDTEWKPEFHAGQDHPIALVQICFRKEFWGYSYPHDSNYLCLLIHVALSGITPKLRDILQDPTIAKSGVVLDQDIQKLSKHFSVELKGFTDIDVHIRQRIYNCQGPSFGMKKLVDMVLGMDLTKSKTVCKSNWESSQLTINQQKYAATDAYACLRLYEALVWQPPIVYCLPDARNMQGYLFPV